MGCSCIFGFIWVGVGSFLGGGRGAGLVCSYLGPPFRTPVQCSHSFTVENRISCFSETEVGPSRSVSHAEYSDSESSDTLFLNRG